MDLPKDIRAKFAKEGSRGGKKRAARLPKARLREIAQQGAAARWGKKKPAD